VRMDAHGKSDGGPLGDKSARLCDFRLVVRRQNHERMCDTRVLRTIDDLAEIVGKFRARDVAVGIN
jgi:hypothetical protein